MMARYLVYASRLQEAGYVLEGPFDEPFFRCVPFDSLVEVLAAAEATGSEDVALCNCGCIVDAVRASSVSSHSSSYTEGYVDGHVVGLEGAPSSPYSDGYRDGRRDGNAVGREAGYSLGYDAGYDRGRDDGDEVGREAGYEVGREAGYDDGNKVGQGAGYEVGYECGYTAGRDAEDRMRTDASPSWADVFYAVSSVRGVPVAALDHLHDRTDVLFAMAVADAVVAP